MANLMILEAPQTTGNSWNIKRFTLVSKSTASDLYMYVTLGNRPTWCCGGFGSQPIAVDEADTIHRRG